MSMLNRRNALTAVATLPALAVPGAMPIASERNLLALEAEIRQVWDHLGSVCEVLAGAEERMHAWEKATPNRQCGHGRRKRYKRFTGA